MDIPLTESVRLVARTGEGAYGPAWGAGVASAAMVQETVTRTVGADGEDVLGDLFVVVPPGMSVKAGDALEAGGRWFDVITVERFGLPLPAAAHHVELVCKSRADAPVATPAEVTGIVWVESDGAAVLAFGAAVEWTLGDDETGDTPEIELEAGGVWHATQAFVNGGYLWVAPVQDFGEGLEQFSLQEPGGWRISTQPAVVVTPLLVPASGTVGWIPMQG